VASVDYASRRAQYPAAFEDSYAALTWLAGQASALGIDVGRLAVGGDSAGGNLAAAVALAARDRRGPRLALQLLIYPVTAHGFDTASYRENGEGYMLTREGMKWFWSHYLAKPRTASSLTPRRFLAKDVSGLAPALVITAEYDRSATRAKRTRSAWSESGVPVTVSRYPGLVHGFIRMMNVLDPAKRAVEEVAAALRKAFA